MAENSAPETKQANPLFQATDPGQNVSFAEYMQDFATQKRTFERTPPPDPDEEMQEVTETQGPETDKEPEPEAPNREDFEKVGKAWFSTTHWPVAFGAQVLAGEYDPTLKIEEEMKAQIQEAWADMSEASGWSRPPAGLQITSLMVGAYGPLYYRAIQARMAMNEKKRAEKAEKYRKIAEQHSQQPQQQQTPPPQPEKKPEVKPPTDQTDAGKSC